LIVFSQSLKSKRAKIRGLALFFAPYFSDLKTHHFGASSPLERGGTGFSPATGTKPA
jgi:hypothetical protein